MKIGIAHAHRTHTHTHTSRLSDHKFERFHSFDVVAVAAAAAAVVETLIFMVSFASSESHSRQRGE